MAWPIRDQGWGQQTSQAIDAYNSGLGFNQNQPMQGYGQQSQQSSGGNSVLDQLAGSLMGNQLGSYLNYGNQLQGAMNQMGGYNMANQQAKLFNNNLNSQMAQTNTSSNAVIQAALANALGNIGSAYQTRLGGGAVDVANINNQGALDRMKMLPGILSGLGGMFNLGGNGASGGGLLGFSGAGGQSAQMGGNATQNAVQAGQPLPQQAEQQATSSASINPMLARMSGRAPVQQSRDYLRQYMGMA